MAWGETEEDFGENASVEIEVECPECGEVHYVDVEAEVLGELVVTSA